MIKPQLAIEYSKVKNLDLSQGYYDAPRFPIFIPFRELDDM